MIKNNKKYLALVTWSILVRAGIYWRLVDPQIPDKLKNQSL